MDRPEHEEERQEERLPRYNELEATIKALRAGRRPEPGTHLPPEFPITAGLLNAGGPADAAPDPSFVARLRGRLLGEVAAEPPSAHTGAADKTATDATAGATASAAEAPGDRARRPARASRRAALTAGLAALAGLATGAAAEALLTESGAPASPSSTAADAPWSGPLVGGAGEWVAVARAAETPVGTAQRFITGAVVGNLIRHSDGSFLALSAACTHMGCLVAWNTEARTFDCPCHGGRFAADGTSLPSSPIRYRPLPQIATRVAQGLVYVWVPAGATGSEQGTPTSGGQPGTGTGPGGYGR